MTASGWLAVGAVVAALLTPSVGAVVVALAAAGAGLAIGATTRDRAGGRGGGRRERIGALLPVSLGSLAIAVRLIAATGSGTPLMAAALPEGRGPWSAIVEARGSDRDGAQVATIRIVGPVGGAGRGAVAAAVGPWLVAATLPRYPSVAPGDFVAVEGAIEGPPTGPYGDYLRRTGVDGTIQARVLSLGGRQEGPAADLEQLRRSAGDALAAAIPEPEAGLAAGIVIGLRDRVDRDLAADFTTVGASHVVAISGWNIAIVAATVAALAGRLGRRRRTVVLVPAIVAYVLFAGASPSVVRAAAMAGVVLLARETGRAGRATAALGWAAAILLVVEPSLVIDAGFQLSSLATAGILAWADRLDRRFRSLVGGRVPGWLAECLAISFAAQAATLPVILLTFGRLALISPLVNLAIVPLVAPAMGAAVVALVGGWLGLATSLPLVAALAGLPAWALLTAMCTIVRAGATVPFASLSLEPPWTVVSALAAATLPVALVVVRGRRSRRPKLAGSAALPAAAIGASPAAASGRGGPRPSASRIERPGLAGRLALVALAVGVGALALAAAHRPDGTTRITVLDVGQGDAILVEGGGGGRMLVDGGPDPDRLLVELDRRLPPWDRRIDILVLTHPHEDHVAGLPLLLERYRVGRIYRTPMRGPGPGYAAFARDLAVRGAPPVATLWTGARIALDDVRFRVLWPDPGRVPLEPPDGGRGINDVSIVLLGEVAGRRFLLTGDVEDDVDPILARRGIPPIDILKVAHHGSATASSPAFLGVVHPSVAIASAGAGNPYGHPARSTIERLAATGARVLRTDTDGSVTVTIDERGAIGVASGGGRRTSRAPLLGPQVAAADAPDRVGPAASPGPSAWVGRAVAFSCGIPSTG